MDTTTQNNNKNNNITQQGCISTVGLSDNERIKAQQKRDDAATNRLALYVSIFNLQRRNK